MDHKKQYLVVECSKCERYLLATSNNKTRTCPYCGKKLKIEKLQALARAGNQETARAQLQKLKLDRADTSSLNNALR